MSDERPRQRQNLERLLKFCVENTASEDPTTESSASVIDPEVYCKVTKTGARGAW